MDNSELKIGLVGLGYWGKNIARNLYELGRLNAICDSNLSSLNRYKDRLIQEGYIEEKCNRCGHNEQRVNDYKAPLLVHFKDKNKMNWKIENIELLCYNCYFLYIGDVFNEKQIKNI